MLIKNSSEQSTGKKIVRYLLFFAQIAMIVGTPFLITKLEYTLFNIPDLLFAICLFCVLFSNTITRTEGLNITEETVEYFESYLLIRTRKKKRYHGCKVVCHKHNCPDRWLQVYHPLLFYRNFKPKQGWTEEQIRAMLEQFKEKGAEITLD